jgi:hypothetical protein
MSASFGNTKYSIFVGGDSVLVGTTLLGAYNQAVTRYIKQVQAFNAANESIQIALPDTSYDAETSTKTSTFTLLATKVWSVVTRKFDLVFATYSDSYGDWVTPTSGNLEGCSTLAEAIYLLANAIQAAYNIMQPNLFIADPSQFASLSDTNNGSVTGSISYLMNQTSDPATGNDVLEINNLLTITDDQQGV